MNWGVVLLVVVILFIVMLIGYILFNKVFLPRLKKKQRDKHDGKENN